VKKILVIATFLAMASIALPATAKQGAKPTGFFDGQIDDAQYAAMHVGTTLRITNGEFAFKNSGPTEQMITKSCSTVLPRNDCWLSVSVLPFSILKIVPNQVLVVKKDPTPDKVEFQTPNGRTVSLQCRLGVPLTPPLVPTYQGTSPTAAMATACFNATFQSNGFQFTNPPFDTAPVKSKDTTDYGRPVGH